MRTLFVPLLAILLLSKVALAIWSWHAPCGYQLDTTFSRLGGIIPKISVLSCAQNYSTTNISPNVRVDNLQTEHRSIALFGTQYTSTCVPPRFNTVPIFPVDVMLFGRCPALRFVISILRNFLLGFIRFGDSFFSLLINLICDVFLVMTVAYVFNERSHVTVILIRIEASRFLFRSHDFAAIMFNLARRLLLLPPTVFQTISRKYMTTYRSPYILFPSLSKRRFQIDASAHDTHGQLSNLILYQHLTI